MTIVYPDGLLRLKYFDYLVLDFYMLRLFDVDFHHIANHKLYQMREKKLAEGNRHLGNCELYYHIEHSGRRLLPK